MKTHTWNCRVCGSDRNQYTARLCLYCAHSYYREASTTGTVVIVPFVGAAVLLTAAAAYLWKIFFS